MPAAECELSQEANMCEREACRNEHSEPRRARLAIWTSELSGSDAPRRRSFLHKNLNVIDRAVEPKNGECNDYELVHRQFNPPVGGADAVRGG